MISKGMTPLVRRGFQDTNINYSKPSLKIRTASDIFWDYIGIFRNYSLKTFFVYQDRKLKLPASV